MKKIINGIVSLLASAALLIPCTALPVNNGGFDPTAGITSYALSQTDTTSIKLTKAKKGDTFDAFKIIEITYDSTTNTLSYDWQASLKDYIETIWDGNTEVKRPLTIEDYKNMQPEQRRNILANVHAYIVQHGIPRSNAESAVANDSGEAVLTDLTMGGYLIAATDTTDVYQMAFKAIEPTANKNGDYELNTANLSVQMKHNPITIEKDTVGKITTAQTNEDISYYIVADVPLYGKNALKKEFVIEDTPPASLNIVADSIKVYSHTDQKAAYNAENWVLMNNPNDYTLETTAIDSRVTKITVTVKNDDTRNQFDNWFSYDFNSDGSHNVNVQKNRIKIEYTAQLNKNADLATVTETTDPATNKTNYTIDYNQNTAVLTYYPYPYTNTPTAKTIEDTHEMYIYGAQIYKYAASGETDTKGLSGAKFKLYSAVNLDPENNTTITGVDESSLVTGYYYSTDGTNWELAESDTVLETLDGNL